LSPKPATKLKTGTKQAPNCDKCTKLLSTHLLLLLVTALLLP
jgi:hypothetical protein